MGGLMDEDSPPGSGGNHGRRWPCHAAIVDTLYRKRHQATNSPSPMTMIKGYDN